MKTVNLAVVTLNSYLAAFSNIMKDYKIIEIMSVLESIAAFVFSIQHVLTLLLAVAFFCLTIDAE